jgi:hypothetical protein
VDEVCDLGPVGQGGRGALMAIVSALRVRVRVWCVACGVWCVVCGVFRVVWCGRGWRCVGAEDLEVTTARCRRPRSEMPCAASVCAGLLAAHRHTPSESTAECVRETTLVMDADDRVNQVACGANNVPDGRVPTTPHRCLLCALTTLHTRNATQRNSTTQNAPHYTMQIRCRRLWSQCAVKWPRWPTRKSESEIGSGGGACGRGPPSAPM